MKKYLSLIGCLVILVMHGCGGSGGNSYSEKTGLLTMNVSKGAISVDMSDTTSSSSNEDVDVNFQYSSYNSNLKALPVVINKYQIDYERTDCSNCPVPPSREVASGLRINPDENKTETITVFSGRDKLSLPVSAVRSDSYNPILNQNPITPDTHTVQIGRGVTASVGAIGDGIPHTVDLGIYTGGVIFNAQLLSPVTPGSVSFKAGDTVVASDNGMGGITGIKEGIVTSETVGTGNGSQTNFTFQVSGGVIPLSFQVKSGSVTGNDNGSGTITGSGVSGTITYQTGMVNIVFTTAPANGTTIQVSYQYRNVLSGTIDYNSGNFSLSSDSYLKKGERITIVYTTSTTTGHISGNTITFDPVVLFSGSSTQIVKGTVLLMIDKNLIGIDNGAGKITGNGVSGLIDYTTGTISSVTITPVPATGVVTVTAALSPKTIILSPTPIVKNSLTIQWKNVSCSETGGVIQAPCSGTINYSTGTISGLSISGLSVQDGTASDINASFSVNSFNVTGGELLGYGTGNSDYIFNLKYIPVARPTQNYNLTIITGSGLTVKDAGGILTGDVCSNKQSTVDYSSGRVSVCFSRGIASNESITAYYKTDSVKLKAKIRAIGSEVGGDTVELSKEIDLIFK